MINHNRRNPFACSVKIEDRTTPGVVAWMWCQHPAIVREYDASDGRHTMSYCASHAPSDNCSPLKVSENAAKHPTHSASEATVATTETEDHATFE